MNIINAEYMAKQLIIKHGVANYAFSFMKTRRNFSAAGNCNWKEKTIKLQPTFVKLNSYEIVRNTILHEIAHALKPRHGHNKFWKRTAENIGCNGTRCYGKEVLKK